jgi:hypothetical protein
MNVLNREIDRELTRHREALAALKASRERLRAKCSHDDVVEANSWYTTPKAGVTRVLCTGCGSEMYKTSAAVVP